MVVLGYEDGTLAVCPGLTQEDIKPYLSNVVELIEPEEQELLEMFGVLPLPVEPEPQPLDWASVLKDFLAGVR